MKKRILSILLVLCMMVATVPILPLTAAAAGTTTTGTNTTGSTGTTTPTPGNTVATVGDFTVTGGALGTDYTFDTTNGVLTVLTDTSLTIANVAPTTATSNRIVVAKDISANITLAGVNIDVSNVRDNCAFEIAKDSTGSVTLTLADDTTNTLKSGQNRAGLEKEGTNGSLTIRCAHSGETGHVCGTTTCGTLEASSGIGAGIGSRSNSPYTVGNIKIKGGNIVASSNLGAGIGGGGIGAGFPEPVSNITISGGNVTASSTNGAGIGIGATGSSFGSVSNITISGGNVTASSSYGAGIGTSYEGFYADITDIIISGGSAKISGRTTAIGKGRGTPVTPKDANGTPVYLCKMDITAPATSVTVNGTSYGKHIYHDGSAWTTEDYAYIYLPNGFYQYGESGLLMNDHGTITLNPTPTATVTGGFTVWGDEAKYNYTDKLLTIKDGAVVMVKNTGSGTTDHMIKVASGASADITLAGVNIDVSRDDDNCAFEIAADSTGSVTLTLADNTENTLTSSQDRAGLEKEGTAGSLTIRCEHSGESGHACATATCGKLKASSSTSGAGIGSGYAQDRNSADVANITILGGNVYASGNICGAGIGSGYAEGSTITCNSGAVSNITISGGNVYAQSVNGAGIGSGHANYGDSGAVSNITVSGGHVTATPNNSDANGIGSGYAVFGAPGAVSNITISGGSVKVKDIGCQPTDGKGNDVYLYEIDNADGEAVTINGKAYPTAHSYYDPSASEWTTKTTIYPYLPGDGSAQVITVGETTAVKLYSGTGFVDAAVLLLDSTGDIKGGYATIQEAVKDAKDGYTVKLMKDIEISTGVNITTSIKLDLNGKKLTNVVGYSGDYALFVNSAGLTVMDSSISGTGEIKMAVTVVNVKEGSFILESGTLTCSSSNPTIKLMDGAKSVTLKGGTVNGNININLNTYLYANGGTVNGNVTGSGKIDRSSTESSIESYTKFLGTLPGKNISDEVYPYQVDLRVGSGTTQSFRVFRGRALTDFAGDLIPKGEILLGWYEGTTKVDLATYLSDGTTEKAPGTYTLTAKFVDTEFDTLNTAIEALKQANTDLNTAIAGKADANTISTSINAVNEAITNLQNELAKKASTTDLNTLKNTVDTLNSAVKTLQNAQSNYSTTTDMNAAIRDAVENAKSGLNASITELQNRMTTVENKVKDLTANKADAADLAAAVADLSKLTTTVSGLSTDLSDLTTTVTGLSTALNSANTTLTNAVDDLKTRMTAAEQKVNDLTANKADAADLAAAVADLSKLTTTVSGLSTDFSGLSTDLSGLTTTVTGLSTALNSANTTLTKAVDDLTKRMTEAEQKVNDLTANKASKTELQNAVDELNALIQALEAVKDNYIGADTALKEELQGQINTANAALKAAEERLDQLESDMNRAQADITKLTTDLTNAQKALNEAIANGDKELSDKISTLNTALEAAQKTLTATDAANKTELEGKITSAQTTLQAAIDQVASDLETAKTELNAAIANGDSALDDKITALNTALENAQKTLNATDAAGQAELSKAIADAQSTLQTAIDKVASDLADAKAALEAKNAALESKDTELEAKDAAQQTFIVVVCILSCVSLSGNVAIGTTIFILKRKRMR